MDHNTPFNSQEVRHGSGSSLPQWRQDDAIYFVTFRLADSLPKPILADWDRRRRDWLMHALDLEKARALSQDIRNPFSLDVDSAIQEISDDARRTYYRKFTVEWHAFLDAGYGTCLLRNSQFRSVVCDALEYFDGERYELGTSVVMPNHIHVLMRPTSSDLSRITHSWKSFTAKKINRLRGGSGTIWLRESYNRIIRSPQNLESYTAYIRANPKKAKLPPSDYTILKG